MDSPLQPLPPIGGTDVESTTGTDVESTVVPTCSPGFCFLRLACLRWFQRLDGATCGSNTTPSQYRNSFVAGSSWPLPCRVGASVMRQCGALPLPSTPRAAAEVMKRKP